MWVCTRVYGSGTDRQTQPVSGILTSKSTFSPSGILGAVSLQRVKKKKKRKKKQNKQTTTKKDFHLKEQAAFLNTTS